MSSSAGYDFSETFRHSSSSSSYPSSSSSSSTSSPSSTGTINHDVPSTSPSFSSLSTCQFSPGSTFFANVINERIIIRSSESMVVVASFVCRFPDPPSGVSVKGKSAGASAKRQAGKVVLKTIKWSQDSTLILAVAPSANGSGVGGACWVFALADAASGSGGGHGEECQPRAIITSGPEGLIRAEWSGSGSEVVCWGEHGLRVSIHSLTTGKTSYIQSPKPISSQSNPSTSAYRPTDRQYFAIAERHKGKDHLSIYHSTDMYNLVRSFALGTVDVQGVCWSPCGRWIAVWDHHLEFTIHIYSPLGPLLGSFKPSSSSFAGEDPGLGIRVVSWSPNGGWLGIGGWDGKVRILESEGWRCICTIDPMASAGGVTKRTTVFKEPLGWYEQVRGHGVIEIPKITPPSVWPALKPDASKMGVRLGISQIEWNPDGTLFCVRTEYSPTMLQIYTFLSRPSDTLPSHISLAVTLLCNDHSRSSTPKTIRHVRWNPRRPRRLAVCVGSNDRERDRTAEKGDAAGPGGSGAIYFWDGDWDEYDEEGQHDLQDPIMSSVGLGQVRGIAEAVGIPAASFEPLDIYWSPDGDILALIDKDRFCVLYNSDDPRPDTDIREEEAGDLNLPVTPPSRSKIRRGDYDLSVTDVGRDLSDIVELE